MNDFEKFIFKFWFKNGTYIEKEVKFAEFSKEDVETFVSGTEDAIEKIRRCLRDGADGETHINNMIVRCSELIAFDLIPIKNKESEE